MRSGKYWKRKEREVIRQLGARSTANSGATWSQKGDGLLGSWCIEVKTTTKDVFKLTAKVLSKLRSDAEVMSRSPMLVVNFKAANRKVFVVQLSSMPPLDLEPSGSTINPWSTGMQYSGYAIVSEHVVRTCKLLEL
jgi:Holliday junction resolvase